MRHAGRWPRCLVRMLLACCGTLWLFYAWYAAASDEAECMIPPTFDPGVGGVYFCPPDVGERHLIAMARSAATTAEAYEDVWLNFRGVFRNSVWINVGLYESPSAALPAWDAMVSLVEWMRAIKAGDAEALQAFLAPLEVSQTYSEADRHVQQRLLTELQEMAKSPDTTPLRAVLYHVHLLPARRQVKRTRAPLNPWLSLPSQEDLFSVLRLAALVPDSEAKIAVPAGIWTYTWNKEQAALFVAKYYKGRTDVPFASKFRNLYLHFALTEYRKQGLHKPAALTPERLRDYVDALRSTGATLHFVFAPDWSAIRPGKTAE